MSQTYQPKKRKRAKKHGFLSRAKTAGGKKTLLRRRRKGRVALSTVKQKVSIKKK
ncbi:MAG: 50S ribosomal protein L34 [Minisyncoccota bacterium]